MTSSTAPRTVPTPSSGTVRTVPLEGVGTVLGAVDDVIERVHRARRQTKGPEGAQRVQDGVQLGGPPRKEQRREHKAVFEPVLRPEQLEPFQHAYSEAGAECSTSRDALGGAASGPSASVTGTRSWGRSGNGFRQGRVAAIARISSGGW